MIIRYGYRKRLDQTIKPDDISEIKGVYNVVVYYSKITNQYIIDYAITGDSLMNPRTITLGYNDFFAFSDEEVKR